MEILAQIVGIEYQPFLSRNLQTYSFTQLTSALSGREATFILQINPEKRFALSWWVSAKRTRSYPYARVYDSLSFTGKKVTIIPIVKDEGREGDRDFLQWDTVSLMSLLGVYTILSYYTSAEKNPRYNDKITNQRYDIAHVTDNLNRLQKYQSDALHWNLAQLDQAGELTKRALKAYTEISRRLGVEMHSADTARTRIQRLLHGKDEFLRSSRRLAQQAQQREVVTDQPKENLTGVKATVTIRNYLGGYYYFTVDEIEIHGSDLYLIEGKHTKAKALPSAGDIKDGLLKMILYTNFENVILNNEEYNVVPVLKLTTNDVFHVDALRLRQRKWFNVLKKEADTNGFRISINNQYLV